jgi:hypothetical protein
MKVGLPSTEAPAVVKGDTSYNTVGQWRLGTPQYLRNDIFFRCKGRIMSEYNVVMRITGMMSIKQFYRQRIRGTLFVPTSNFYMKIKGSLATLSTAGFLQRGIVRQSSVTNMRVTGVMGDGLAFVHKCISFCKANHHAIYRQTGVLQQIGKYYARATGTLLANASSNYRVTGVLRQASTAIHKCIGLSGQGASGTMVIRGVLQQASISIHRCTGGLANTAGHIFMKVKGKINIAAFVSAVPKRVQEFYTNKRWFN